MEYIPLLITVALAHLLAVISPGPDFVMITRNSLIYSRKTGIYSALGLGLGILVHVTYSLVGIGLLISQSILLFTILKFVGAIYLLYIGYKSLTAKTSSPQSVDAGQEKDISPRKAVRMGFITNATNPKATLFFLSLFTLIIGPTTPLYLKILMGLEMAVVTFLWFALVATVFSHGSIKGRVAKFQGAISKITGVIFILLGLKLATSSAK